MATSNSGGMVKSAVLCPAEAKQVMQVGCDNKAAATDYYLQLFRGSALPADGTVPDLEKFAPRLAHTTFDWQAMGGVRFTNGLVAAISTTPGVLTLAGTADAWLQAVYA